MGHILESSDTPRYKSLLKRASFRRQPAFVKVAAKVEEEIRLRDLKERSMLTRIDQLKNHYSIQIHYVTKKWEWYMGCLGLPWVAREEDVWDQSAVFCKEFIHAKLKRVGFLGTSTTSSRNGAVRAGGSSSSSSSSSSAAGRGFGSGQRVSAVCRELTVIGAELERLYPTLYRDITKQLNITMSSEAVVEQVLFDIGDAIFKPGITWAKIVALFVVSSSLSVECMQQGNGIYVHSITVALTRYVQTKLVRWIAQRGGWVDLLRTFRRKPNETSTLWLLTIGGAFIGLLVSSIFASRIPFLSLWKSQSHPEE